LVKANVSPFMEALPPWLNLTGNLFLKIGKRRWHSGARIWALGNSISSGAGTICSLHRADQGGLEMEGNGKHVCGDADLLLHV
jgi:hypothetical protein